MSIFLLNLLFVSIFFTSIVDVLLRAAMFSDQLGEEMRKNVLSYPKLYDHHQVMSRKPKKLKISSKQQTKQNNIVVFLGFPI